MKKSVVILIAIIYVASIALVSFFGLQYQTFFEVVYSESIELLDPNIKVNNKGENYIVVNKNAEGEFVYKIEYRLHPDNATNDKVFFSYDEGKANQLSITVSEDGVVKFPSKGGTIVVTVMAADGTGVSAKLKIYAV